MKKRRKSKCEVSEQRKSLEQEKTGVGVGTGLEKPALELGVGQHTLRVWRSPPRKAT